MLWYIEKQEFYHKEILGPYDTRKQAEQNRPRDFVNGRPESHVSYRIFESEELL